MRRGDIIQTEPRQDLYLGSLIKAFTSYSKNAYDLGNFHPTHCMIVLNDKEVYTAEGEGMTIKPFQLWLDWGFKYRIYRPTVSNEVMETALAHTLESIHRPYAWWQYEVHFRKFIRETFNVFKRLANWKYWKVKDTKKMRAFFTKDEVCTESVYRYMKYMGMPQSNDFDESSINNCEIEAILMSNKSNYTLVKENL